MIRFGSIFTVVVLTAIGCGSSKPGVATDAHATSSSTPASYSIMDVRAVLGEHGLTVEGAPHAPFYLADLDHGAVVNSAIGAVYFAMFRSPAAAQTYLASASGVRELRGWVGEPARRVVKRNVVFFEPTNRSAQVRSRVETAVAAFPR